MESMRDKRAERGAARAGEEHHAVHERTGRCAARPDVERRTAHKGAERGEARAGSVVRLAGFELVKIWGKRRFWLAAAAVLLINLFLLWYANLPDDGQPPLSAYKAIGRDIEGLSETGKQNLIAERYEKICGVLTVQRIINMQAVGGEMGEAIYTQELEENREVYEKYYDLYKSGKYLRYTDSLEQEEALLTEVYTEMETVREYPQYLREIQENEQTLNGISIFASADQDTFSGRNIAKSAADYRGLESVKTVFYPSKGIASAMQNPVSDVLLIAIVFLFAGGLIYEEKEKKLFFVTRAAAAGRRESMTAKLLAVAVHAAAVTAAVYISNLIFFAAATGLGDLSRSIQSAAPFLESDLRISVFAFLVLSVLTKAAVLFVIGALLVLVSVLFRLNFMPYLAGAAFLAGNWLLYAFVPAWSAANGLKYLNLFGLLRAENLYGGYLNLNLGGYPVSRLGASWTALAVYAAAVCAAVIVLFVKIRSMDMKKARIASAQRYRPHTGLLRHEGYKILIMNRGLFLLLIFVALLGWQHLSRQHLLSPQEEYYRSIMMQLEGEYTGEKAELIEKEQARYEEAFAQIDAIDARVAAGEIDARAGDSMKEPYYAQTAFYPAFQRVEQQYEKIKENGGEFIYDTGYLYLSGFRDNGSAQDFLLLTVCLILLFCNVLSMEDQKKSWGLLAATARGKRQIVQKKCIVCLLAAAVGGAAVFALRLSEIARAYPLHGLSGSLKNLPVFYQAGLSVPIAVWIGGLLLRQLLALMVVTVIVLVISGIVRAHLPSLFVSALILALPLILREMGFAVAGYFSLLGLYG